MKRLPDVVLVGPTKEPVTRERFLDDCQRIKFELELPGLLEQWFAREVRSQKSDPDAVEAVVRLRAQVQRRLSEGRPLTKENK
jgi:hypothetical protein